jgi:hypothetical protein
MGIDAALSSAMRCHHSPTCSLEKEIKKMKGKKESGLIILSALVLIATLVFFDNVFSTAENPAWPRAVFFVS